MYGCGSKYRMISVIFWNSYRYLQCQIVWLKNNSKYNPQWHTVTQNIPRQWNVKVTLLNICTISYSCCANSEGKNLMTDLDTFSMHTTSLDRYWCAFCWCFVYQIDLNSQTHNSGDFYLKKKNGLRRNWYPRTLHDSGDFYLKKKKKMVLEGIGTLVRLKRFKEFRVSLCHLEKPEVTWLY